MGKKLFSIPVEGSKYTVEQDATGNLSALRNGEPWIGEFTLAPKMLVAMAYELYALRKAYAAALKVQAGEMTATKFLALQEELRGITDFEANLANPGTV